MTYTSIQSLDEVKYFVIRSSLLKLFTHCPSGLCSCPGKTTKPEGTFVTIKHACSHCGYQRSWSSQHYIKDIPAGTIMLSAAILYSCKISQSPVPHESCMHHRTNLLHSSKQIFPASSNIMLQSQVMRAGE